MVGLGFGPRKQFASLKVRLSPFLLFSGEILAFGGYSIGL